jgi:hypothetical protein
MEVIYFLLEIMTLVSSVNIMGSDKVLIVGGRSFVYILEAKALELTPEELPCFIIAHSEQKFWVLLNDFISTFCHLPVR